MSEEGKNNLEQLGEKLAGLPEDVAASALDQYAARMEAFADGFKAGKAYAERPGA